MQSIYFNDKSIQHESKQLNELGIEDQSEFDFCVDGEITCVTCEYNKKKYESNHMERCLVSNFSQDIYSVFSLCFLLLLEMF